MCQPSTELATTASTQSEAPAPQQFGLVKSLAAGRTIAAAAIAEGDSCEFASPHYFALCGLGGMLT